MFSLGLTERLGSKN